MRSPGIEITSPGFALGVCDFRRAKEGLFEGAEREDWRGCLRIVEHCVVHSICRHDCFGAMKGLRMLLPRGQLELREMHHHCLLGCLGQEVTLGSI